MESNQLGSGKLENLQVGETLLVDAKKVKNGKIQLHFAEKLTGNDKPINALTILNASDSAFSSGARRAWVTAEVADAAERFNVNFGDDGDWYAATSSKGEDVEIMDLNILSPHIVIKGNVYDFKVQVLETTVATEWQSENYERAAKRKGKNGDHITHKGDYIFSNTTVILNPKGTEVKHTFLESDENTSKAVNKVTEMEMEQFMVK
jgi:hypothetical protein|tara:strand:+ start:278 stop:895 length:618 start_codon:yes stop_codon:yes gene_type:complete